MIDLSASELHLAHGKYFKIVAYYYQYYLIIGSNFSYDYTINFNYLTRGSLKLAC